MRSGLPNGQRRARRAIREMRTALLAGAVVGLIGAAAEADPVADVAMQAAAIERLIDEGKAAEGEVAARAALALAESSLGSDTAPTADLVELVGAALFAQRRYAEAEPFYLRTLEIRTAALGLDHADTAIAAANVANTLWYLERRAEAEPYLRQALEIRKVALGPEHADTANTARNLAELLREMRDNAAAATVMAEAIAAGERAFGESHETIVRWRGLHAIMLHDAGDLASAEAVYQRALAEAAVALPGDRATLADWRLGLGNLMRQTRRFAEAEGWYRLSLADREAAWGADHANVLPALEGVAIMLENQDRNGEALSFYKRGLALRETVNGPESGPVGALAMRIGVNLLAIDEPVEAEAALRRALAIREVVQGPESEGVADAARRLGQALERQRRDAEAETFRRRALAVSDKVNGPDHVLTAFDMIFLGMLYAGQHRFGEAEPLLTRALAIMEGMPQIPQVANAARGALIYLLEAQGRMEEAEERIESALAAAIEADGASSFEAASFMDSLARIRLRRGDHEEAERLARAALAVHEDSGRESARLHQARRLLANVLMETGRAEEALAIHADVLARLRERFEEDAPQVRLALEAVGRAYFALGDFARAAEHLERSVEHTHREAERNIAIAFHGGTGAVEDQALATAGTAADLVRAWYRLTEGTPELAEKAFLLAQRIIDSQAAAALSQMGARQAAGSGELAALVRERQDLADAWRLEDRRRTEMLAMPLDQRDPERMAATEERLKLADERLEAIDRRLAAEFPEYARMQAPSTLAIAGVQAALAEDQVLLFYADMTRRGGTDFETFLWAVPKEGEARWLRLDRHSGALSADVHGLRGLMGVGPETRGAAPLAAATRPDRTGEVLAAAHDLYRVVLGPAADMIEGKHLVVVPSERLAGLPFHLLVSGLPAASDDRYRDARWVARDHAITVLPSVAALTAPAGPQGARDGEREPFIGFANPLLVGRSGQDRRAFGREGCGPAEPAETPVAAVELPALATLFRGAAADVDAVRALAPLPETVDEACAIAAALGAGPDSVRQGADATEAEVKRLSEEGRLARASIVHFATHGLISGELSGLAEPAIVLTPPEEGGPHDDGLLTASEVTTLKLDADWVILSACNTAAGDGGGEALSGLARAFFYAGARALMVSHWPVNSDAAVRLATGTIDEFAADPALDRAEALRRTMVAEIERGGRYAEPSNWAPFILVGTARSP